MTSSELPLERLHASLQRVILRAQRIALERGHTEVDLAHIMLAALDDPHARAVLAGRNAQLDAVASTATDLVGTAAPRRFSRDAEAVLNVAAGSAEAGRAADLHDLVDAVSSYGGRAAFAFGPLLGATPTPRPPRPPAARAPSEVKATELQLALLDRDVQLLFVNSQRLAKQRTHECVDTVHLFRVLLDDAPGAEMLARFGIDIHGVRRAIDDELERRQKTHGANYLSGGFLRIALAAQAAGQRAGGLASRTHLVTALLELPSEVSPFFFPKWASH